MTETNMTIYDELVARGLIAQVTNEEEISVWKSLQMEIFRIYSVLFSKY